MIITIAAIAGFQAYWLRDNYLKEEKNLQFRADVSFAETIKTLQAKNLKLNKFLDDSVGNFKLRLTNGDFMSGPPLPPGEEFASVLDDVSVIIKDSISKLRETASKEGQWVEHIGIDTRNIKEKNDAGKDKNMVIAYSKSGVAALNDSVGNIRIRRANPSGEIIQFLYSVDSLQDSLRVSAIDSAFRVALNNQGINVPFSVSRHDSLRINPIGPSERKPMNKITIGFRHPVTYEMKLGNSFAYLLKKIASPVLFSLFLVGVTILSFLLLYRNLLRQRRLADIKNEFISNITHELKTPIATVGVAIEALRNFNAINDPARTKEYLDISQNELQRLSLLVDKVLKLSMFEKQEIELKYEELELKDIVDEVVSSMKLQLDKHNATVLVSNEGITRLEGDRLHLLSVVFNLLDNALKYSNGNTAIKINMKENENEVELSVADNGIGISPEYKEKVFEKFFRVPDGNKHNTKGYGLGLSYVAHVVERHRGRIQVESQQGLGTKFIITLPRKAT